MAPQKVFIKCPLSVWKLVDLISYENEELKYLEDGEEKTTKTDKLLLKNPEILIGQNDLTTLSYLHEPSVLYNLSYRFELKTIYTYCGIVLVAINPYEEIDIYNRETILAYRGGEGLDPHIFKVAEGAYGAMERFSLNQSIIVSGESGAGKTVSAKYAMRYFAVVGGSERDNLEEKVLASQPIMEAIGNAKTIRNDNSSRFGKYIELHFNKKYQISSASIVTYLLEKSRVTSQSIGERNYHIFYQITSNRSHSELSELYLEEANYYNYTNSETLKDDFEETVKSLILLGFGLDIRRNIFKLLASILQLGNVNFGNQDVAKIRKDDENLTKFCKLLELDFDSIRKLLSTKELKTGNEIVTKNLSPNEAVYSRDALAKLLYSELFNFIVKTINNEFKISEYSNFIGVLDIYGFETFENNSFEQFCINYANEKLQQQFNSHVFKLEQSLYIREGISWTMIDFHDNQPCIDLIESKLGILDLLDEECKLGSGSDKSWLLKLHNRCKNNAHYVVPKIYSDKSFVVMHFADSVSYCCHGFIDKNRDNVEVGVVKGVVKNPFLSKIITTTTTKKTLSSSFRTSLSSLMTSLNKTTPSYVRCIKPNDAKKPFQFDPHRAVQQLRACGVLETIRISAAGFPSRWSYGDFYSRYKMLDKVKVKDAKIGSENLIEGLINKENYRLGKSLIFFRSGEVAFLEKLRLEKLQKNGLIVQKVVRGWGKRCCYVKIRKSAALLQNYGRGFIARKLARKLREIKAAVAIQKCFRRYFEEKRYRNLKKLVQSFQSVARGYILRRKVMETKKINAIIVIQSYFRGIISRKKNIQRKQKIILAQSCIRRFLAKKRLKVLKTQAKSIEHVKMLNKGLENKIIELQMKVGDYSKENKLLKNKEDEVEKLKIEINSLKNVEKELKSVKNALKNRENEINNLTEENSREKMLIADLSNELSKQKENLEKITIETSLKTEIINELRQKVNELEQKINENSDLAMKIANLEQELDLEKIKYQEAIFKITQPVPSPRNLLKNQELQKDYEKIKSDYEKLLHSNDVGDELLSKIKTLETENKNLKNEKLEFRSVLNEEGENNVVKNLQIALKIEKQKREKLEQELKFSYDDDLIPFNLKKKNHIFQGMLEYKQEDLSKILKLLIIDLQPAIAMKTIHSLPAYIIFLMIRYTDYVNDDERVRSLLTKAVTNFKKIVRKKGENVDYLILWSCNILRLLHCLKQYSGDAVFSGGGDKCLKNFDLSEYRGVLSDHALWVYMLLIKNLEDQIQPLLVPAILESTHESESNRPIDALKSTFEQTFNLLESYGLDTMVIEQIFKQLFYFVCAGALNNLLLRRELCHWSKGMDIRYNISVMQDWSRSKNLPPEIITTTMTPLMQASQLLQVRKTDSDVLTICDICDKLSVQQVIKLLNLYSSKDGLDTDKVSKTLIAAVQSQLNEMRVGNENKQSLLMDTKFSFAVTFDFNPSGVKLEEIEIPSNFGLDGLVKML